MPGAFGLLDHPQDDRMPMLVEQHPTICVFDLARQFRIQDRDPIPVPYGDATHAQRKSGGKSQTIRIG